MLIRQPIPDELKALLTDYTVTGYFDAMCMSNLLRCIKSKSVIWLTASPFDFGSEDWFLIAEKNGELPPHWLNLVSGEFIIQPVDYQYYSEVDGDYKILIEHERKVIEWCWRVNLVSESFGGAKSDIVGVIMKIGKKLWNYVHFG